MGAVVTAVEGVAPTLAVASRAAVTTGVPTEAVASMAAVPPTAPPVAAVTAMAADGVRSEDHLRHAMADRALGPQKAKAFAIPLRGGTDFNDRGTALREQEDPPVRAPAWRADPRANDRRVQLSLDDPVPKRHTPQWPTDNGMPLAQPTALLHLRRAQEPDRHWLQMPTPQAQHSTAEPWGLTGAAEPGAAMDGATEVGAAAVGASA
jgi:hypothetical protein